MSAIEFAYARFCRTRFPVPTQAQVRAFEQLMGLRFPTGYRDFLLTYNGGYFTEPEFFTSEDDSLRDRLRLLYGLGEVPDDANLANPGNWDLFDDNNPMQILPNGYTHLNNLIVLIVRPSFEEQLGEILLKKAFSDEFLLLASDIEEFFSLLSEPNGIDSL